MLAYAGTLEGCAVKMLVIFRSHSRNNNGALINEARKKTKCDAATPPHGFEGPAIQSVPIEQQAIACCTAAVLMPKAARRSEMLLLEVFSRQTPRQPPARERRKRRGASARDAWSRTT